MSGESGGNGLPELLRAHGDGGDVVLLLGVSGGRDVGEIGHGTAAPDLGSRLGELSGHGAKDGLGHGVVIGQHLSACSGHGLEGGGVGLGIGGSPGQTVPRVGTDVGAVFVEAFAQLAEQVGARRNRLGLQGGRLIGKGHFGRHHAHQIVFKSNALADVLLRDPDVHQQIGSFHGLGLCRRGHYIFHSGALLQIARPIGGAKGQKAGEKAEKKQFPVHGQTPFAVTPRGAVALSIVYVEAGEKMRDRLAAQTRKSRAARLRARRPAELPGDGSRA